MSSMQFRPLARALSLHVRMSLRAGSIAFNVHLTVLLTCLIHTPPFDDLIVRHGQPAIDRENGGTHLLSPVVHLIVVQETAAPAPVA